MEYLIMLLTIFILSFIAGAFILSIRDWHKDMKEMKNSKHK